MCCGHDFVGVVRRRCLTVGSYLVVGWIAGYVAKPTCPGSPAHQPCEMQKPRRKHRVNNSATRPPKHQDDLETIATQAGRLNIVHAPAALNNMKKHTGAGNSNRLQTVLKRGNHGEPNHMLWKPRVAEFTSGMVVPCWWAGDATSAAFEQPRCNVPRAADV